MISLCHYGKLSGSDTYCCADGKGNGEWKKISVSNPSLIRTSIKHKTVHKFEKDSVSLVVQWQNYVWCRETSLMLCYSVLHRLTLQT